MLTFLTDQYSKEKTAGARVALPQASEPNTYGCIPFAYLHYRAPVRQFWTPGPGTFLRKAELRINDRLSELDELIQKYARPIGVFKNVAPTFSPEVGPGRFLRMLRGGTGYTGEGFADGGDPSAEYLQAQLAIEGIWLDLEKYIKQVAGAVELPYQSLELEYGDAPSGISLIIKEWPLLQRARNRRRLYQMAETCLARVILMAAGNHYGTAGLAESAKNLNLLLAWAEPAIPVPGPDRDQSDEWEVSMGLKSRVAVAMDRYGLTREQAIEHIKQTAADEQEITAIIPQKSVPGEMQQLPEADDTEGTEGPGPGPETAKQASD